MERRDAAESLQDPRDFHVWRARPFPCHPADICFAALCCEARFEACILFLYLSLLAGGPVEEGECSGGSRKVLSCGRWKFVGYSSELHLAG